MSCVRKTLIKPAIYISYSDTTVSSPFVVNTSSQLVDNTPVSDISSQTSTINKGNE